MSLCNFSSMQRVERDDVNWLIKLTLSIEIKKSLHSFETLRGERCDICYSWGSGMLCLVQISIKLPSTLHFHINGRKSQVIDCSQSFSSHYKVLGMLVHWRWIISRLNYLHSAVFRFPFLPSRVHLRTLNINYISTPITHMNKKFQPPPG